MKLLLARRKAIARLGSGSRLGKLGRKLGKCQVIR
jgi:hypothetical protein